jgi:hypothetical protein
LIFSQIQVSFMRDFAVHEESRVARPRGLRRVIRPMRRVLVLILLPVFRRLSALLQDLDADQCRLSERQGCMAHQLDDLLNSGWDQAALLRRVAALERQVEMLKLLAIPDPGVERPDDLPAKAS